MGPGARKTMEVLAFVALGSILAARQAATAGTSTSQRPAEEPAASPSRNLPAFEVATIKPYKPNTSEMEGVTLYPGGKVVIDNVTLQGLIAIAFELNFWQVSGGDAWVSRARYDVVALPPEEMRPHITDLRHSWFGIDDPTLRRMLQALLINRFQLRFHFVTRTGAVYELERSSRPFRLHPVKTKAAEANLSYGTPLSGQVEFVNGRWYIFDTSMPELTAFASAYVLDRPVFDRTGVTGAFDYKSELQVDPTNMQSQFHDTFLQLLKEVGLKLKSAKGPVQTFVIDHADTPSPN